MPRNGRLAAVAVATAVGALSGCGQSRPIAEGGDASFGHGPGFVSPAEHGPAFFAFLRGTPGSPQCNVCHGPSFEGGAAPSCNECHAAAGWTADWRSNCSFCHGTPTPGGFDLAVSPELAAPPDDVAGRLTGTNTPAQTGAHRVHLTGSAIAAAFACRTCHAVPEPTSSLDHVASATVQVNDPLDGSGQASLPAGLGSYRASDGTCAVYCHGGAGGPTGGKVGVPAWGTPLPRTGDAYRCDSCHGNALATATTAAYPDTGEHAFHDVLPCASCHAGVVTSTPATTAPAIADPSLHVNGVRDVAFGGTFSGKPVTGTFTGGATPTCSSVSCHESGEPRDW
jgi:predicted CxxxxCH...CXXCH cytochrome family protein